MNMENNESRTRRQGFPDPVANGSNGGGNPSLARRANVRYIE